MIYRRWARQQGARRRWARPAFGRGTKWGNPASKQTNNISNNSNNDSKSNSNSNRSQSERDKWGRHWWGHRKVHAFWQRDFSGTSYNLLLHSQSARVYLFSNHLSNLVCPRPRPARAPRALAVGGADAGGAGLGGVADGIRDPRPLPNKIQINISIQHTTINKRNPRPQPQTFCKTGVSNIAGVGGAAYGIGTPDPN